VLCRPPTGRAMVIPLLHILIDWNSVKVAARVLVGQNCATMGLYSILASEIAICEHLASIEEPEPLQNIISLLPDFIVSARLTALIHYCQICQ
jgi:hypothetical protein